jgi:predicted anti-sigma-YlaC factor YlaD
MKNRHILEILDRTNFAEIKDDELKSVQAHTAVCADCRQAFEAARISAALLNARAAASTVIEPTAFFQSKVLNALQREKQNLRKPIAAFWRWWQASYPLVCSMLFIVVTLAVLTLFAPKSNVDQAVSTYNLYSTDSVILNQRPPRSLTTEQALEVIYNERRDAVKR